MLKTLLDITGFSVAGLTAVSSAYVAQITMPLKLPQSPEEIYSMGTGPILVVICFALCYVVLKQFKIQRADAAIHHAKRDEVQERLILMIETSTTAHVEMSNAMKTLTSQIHDQPCLMKRKHVPEE